MSIPVHDKIMAIKTLGSGIEYWSAGRPLLAVSSPWRYRFEGPLSGKRTLKYVEPAAGDDPKRTLSIFYSLKPAANRLSLRFACEFDLKLFAQLTAEKFGSISSTAFETA